jgi:DNA-binding NtrC family response regulator
VELDWKAHPILYVDDDRENLDVFRFNFRKAFTIHTAASGAEGLDILKRERISVVVADQRMPGMSGLEFLLQARAAGASAVGVILTAYTDVQVLIDAINSGTVYRYVSKPWDRAEMQAVLHQAIERRFLEEENRRLARRLEEMNKYLHGEVDREFSFGFLVGGSPQLREVLATVERVAPTNSTVLLRGESGTGKELVARAIHMASPRADGPFVRVACGALATGVLESELFGHEKGAFTGAVAQRLGRFELAHRGTIFLDEIGDLPAETQIRLLRVLQEREIERVGGSETLHVDVRVISATNRDLESRMAQGQFREDLYYRLNVFPILLPPLRERKSDIPELVSHFLEKLGRLTGKCVTGVTPEALAVLSGYDWPGNVREMENVIERAMILARGETIEAADIAIGTHGGAAARPAEPGPKQTAGLDGMLGDIERNQLLATMERCQGNKAEVARALGINRSTLYYRLHKHGLE